MSIQEPLGDRVIGMDLERLRNVSRSVGISGGKQKFPAILGALRGGWINIVNYRPIYGEAPGYGLSGIVFGLPQQSNCRFDSY
jgi:Putative sugar-binding domain